MDSIYTKNDWEKIQETLSKVTGFSIIILNLSGRYLSSTCACQKFCLEIRKNFELKKVCERSDQQCLAHCRTSNQFYIHQCPFNLLNIVFPIHVQEKHIASLFVGQIRLSKQDWELLKKEFPFSTSYSPKYEEIAKQSSLYQDISSHTLEEIQSFIRLFQELTRSIIPKIIEEKSEITLQKEIEKKMLELEFATTTTQERFEFLLDYLHRERKKNCTLEELSDISGLSKSYISMLFPKRTGYRFSEYCQRLKVEEASKQLKNTTLPIQDIAMEVGFYDVSYFSKIFKKYNGLTPKQYRNQ
ncbi:AraC-type DNA-binding protein [Pilibacter termitis]|uniref:AraC-type DNA-binding protein n=1 Tax=Pilibacter termitis TaxID=263852 RepID=A0A1T4K112_9ENTE|nr:PocR ligand-binding domain-containing protein [Pilibacter termitis]SJZ36140.1 AraC-type DNA-binding protein [Pilibacter termitis]